MSHAHFRFWGHEHLTDRLISKCYPKSDAAQWVEKSSWAWWHRIQLVTCKSSAWAFYRGVVALSLNVNATAHRSALKNASILVWIQLYPPCTIYEVLLTEHYQRYAYLQGWHQGKLFSMGQKHALDETMVGIQRVGPSLWRLQGCIPEAGVFCDWWCVKTL